METGSLKGEPLQNADADRNLLPYNQLVTGKLTRFCECNLDPKLPSLASEQYTW